MAYPKLNGDPELLKLRTEDGDIRELTYKREKHDYENTLVSLKIDNTYHGKNFQSINKNFFLIFSEIFNRIGRYYKFLITINCQSQSGISYSK